MLEILGCTPEYRAAGKGFLVTGSHIRQLDAAQAGAPLRICSRVLGAGDGRLHLWHEMMSGARLLASAEHLLEHADLDTRQACAPDPALAEAMRQLARALATTPAPEGAGRVRPG